MQRKGLMVVMLLGWLFGPPSMVQKASEAYHARQYPEALKGYLGAIDQYPGQEPALNFNIAQSWVGIDSLAKAMTYFGKVTNASQQSPQFASWAWNNLGCIFASDKNPQMTPQPQGGMPMGAPQMGAQPAGPSGASQQDQMAAMEQALKAFKDALKLDNDNDIARYNYELLKRRIQQQQQNQNQDQQQQDQQQEQQEQQDQQNTPDQQNDAPQPQENKGNQQQGQGGDPQQMSAAEAERLLEAMNANEKKFLQQLEKGRKRRTYNEDGPDW